MPLKPGTQLGPYEILSAIGAGGMGEVYKARDSRLDRVVAIKVLPAHLADRTDVRERFEREAKTVASLNHPHICVLHDIGRQDGIDFLVMEYLEGESLAARLTRGALPMEQVLRYAIEIADALDKAHRRGVTHRDLKPGNIMLTKEGTKLLDFGLAKLRQETRKQNFLDSQAPTPAPAGRGAPSPTMEGTILGTLQYMAPEQVEGKTEEIDARSDIFAFGVVVYEMVTGKKAFQGNSTTSVMAAILKDDPPPMSSLQPVAPAALDRVVKKCLAKDPAERWQSASDLTDTLKLVTEGVLAAPAATTTKAARSSWRKRLTFSLVGLLAWALTAWLIWNFRSPELKPVTRTAVPVSPDHPLGANSIMPLAISPDGSRLVFAAQYGADSQLYVRAMDSLEATPLSGTEGADMPFFSPDGQWVGFASANNLKKVPITGGAALTLSPVAGFRGASWGADDRIIFAGTAGVLARVSAAGGTPEVLTQLKGEITHRWPEILPGGKAVLFTAARSINYDDAQIAVQRLDTGERKTLIQGGAFPHYISTGHIVYYRAGTILAVPFDLKRLEVIGSPAPVVEGVMSRAGDNGSARFSISRSGSLVYVAGRGQGALGTLVWVDRKGTAEPLKSPPQSYASGPRLSPDGRQVAITIGTDIWVYSAARDTLTRLTFEGSNTNPAWSRDGKRVVFASSRGGSQNLFWKPADGSGPEERLITGQEPLFTGSFTPDGRTLLYAQNNPQTGRDIWILPLDGDRKPRVFLKTPFNETAPRLSPDGRWVAYNSDESGRNEIYVQPFPGPGGKWQISTEGGRELIWAANGEIFYRNRDKLMVVETKTQPAFEAGKPQVLFEYPSSAVAARMGVGANYDVTAAGRRFITLKDSDAGGRDSASTQINVVLNWFEELKRKVPTK